MILRLTTLILLIFSLSSNVLSNSANEYAKPYSINASITPVNFPIPLSYGLNAYYKMNENWSLGADLQRSKLTIGILGLDIGEAKETTFTIIGKRHITDSLNLKLGLGTRKTQVLFAENLLDLATANYQETASEFNAKYLRFGIANIWNFKNDYRLEVDWLTVDIPVNAQVKQSAAQYASNQENTDNIESAENILKYYPGGSVVKISIGLVF